MDTPITDMLRKRMLQSFADFHNGKIYAEDAAAQFSEIFQQVGILEKDRDHWRANHDNQKKLKEILTDRPDLADRAARMQELIFERDFVMEELADANTEMIKHHQTMRGTLAEQIADIAGAAKQYKILAGENNGTIKVLDFGGGKFNSSFKNLKVDHSISE